MMTADLEQLRLDYPIMLRYAQAIELCQQIGVSERAFRGAVKDGSIPRKVYSGQKLGYYRREQIIAAVTGRQEQPSTIE